MVHCNNCEQNVECGACLRSHVTKVLLATPTVTQASAGGETGVRDWYQEAACNWKELVDIDNSSPNYGKKWAFCQSYLAYCDEQKINGDL